MISKFAIINGNKWKIKIIKLKKFKIYQFWIYLNKFNSKELVYHLRILNNII